MDQHRHGQKTEFSTAKLKNTTSNENCQNTFPLYRTDREEDYGPGIMIRNSHLASDINVKTTYIKIICIY